MQHSGKADAAVIDVSEKQRSRGHQKNFAGIDRPPSNIVEFTEFKNAGEKETENDRKSGDIDGHNGNVPDNESPTADKGRRWPKTDIGIGKGTAGHRGVFDHVTETYGDEADKACANKKSHQRPHRPCLRKKHIAWENKAAPPYDGSKS